MAIEIHLLIALFMKSYYKYNIEYTVELGYKNQKVASFFFVAFGS